MGTSGGIDLTYRGAPYDPDGTILSEYQDPKSMYRKNVPMYNDFTSHAYQPIRPQMNIGLNSQVQPAEKAVSPIPRGLMQLVNRGVRYWPGSDVRYRSDEMQHPVNSSAKLEAQITNSKSNMQPPIQSFLSRFINFPTFGQQAPVLNTPGVS